jgi:hypothetical protein
MMNTVAPSLEKRLAVARPIPELPPVTTAVLPLNLPIIEFLSGDVLVVLDCASR